MHPAHTCRCGRVVAVSIDANMGCRGLESLPVPSLWKSQRFPGQGPFLAGLRRPTRSRSFKPLRCGVRAAALSIQAVHGFAG